ncbi:MAG: RES domain-containing protein [Rhodocyclaceae bacterium]|nr:RES domain-containing protein [Rhodocyclaceae bacterium]
MNDLFSGIALADVHEDMARNIVSLRHNRNLFDDLSSDPTHWALAQRVEDAVKPPADRSVAPIIHRPLEDADWFGAIDWPFRNWRESRYSDGSFGVWYGSESVETTVYESAYHWYDSLLGDAGYTDVPVSAERRVWWVACDAALLDLRPAAPAHPGLLHPSDYSYAQQVGARIHREGHPGLLTRSARRADGCNAVIFRPGALSTPRQACYLTYRLQPSATPQIIVEKQPGQTWLTLDVAALYRGVLQ